MKTISMKKISVLVLVVLLGAVGERVAVAQSGYDLFQKALVKERAEGNLEEAIQLYRRIVQEHAGNRALAAKALVQMGQCYEKLGKAEARKAYERVLREYADQAEAAAEARARLAALTQPTAAATAMVERRVLSGPTTDPLGSPSPDGRYLALTDWVTGDLALYDLTTGQHRRLTKKGTWFESYEFALFPCFSQDGKQIAYAWFTMDNVWQLRVMSLEAGEPRVLMNDKQIEFILPVGWSPDGRQILAGLIRPDRGNQAVFITATDGSVRVLKTFDKSLGASGGGKVSLSPDGRYVVYDLPPKEDRIERDIFILSTDGKLDAPLIEHPADDRHPVWSPDGRRVVFASDRRGTMGLWALEVVDGKPHGTPEMVRSEIGQFWPMGFTQEGSYYYGLNTGMTDVYVAKLDIAAGKVTQEPEVIGTRHVGANTRPAWSPDGKYLAFVFQTGPFAPGYNRVTLSVRSVETAQQRDFSLNLNNVRRPSWSPDGRSLVFAGEDRKGLLAVYRMDVQSGELKTLFQVERGINLRWPQFLPDGKHLLYERLGLPTKTRSLIVRDLETGEERELARAVAPAYFGGVSLSPDGQRVAYIWSQGGETQSRLLRVMPIEGGEPRDLFKRDKMTVVPSGFAPQWTPDGNYILIVQSPRPTDQRQESANDYTLWRVSTRDGEAKPLGLVMKQLRDIALHPDGVRLAFAAGETGSEVWVMENFLPVAKASK